MILYCGDHDEQFDTDYDVETHRFCHDTSGHAFTSEPRHTHKCYECCYEWEHEGDACEGGFEATCPHCED